MQTFMPQPSQRKKEACKGKLWHFFYVSEKQWKKMFSIVKCFIDFPQFSGIWL